ncbi:unnamed protein product [Cylindrotheca closterium]|uniref:Matrin-type domain-containing protein n=1 Tax=Cylindrotheca closterium TaxID=2856 RepID=A0AAD2FQF0_9STRA|nr:unnamed protein product [Cylindrotheca closterium]
MSSNLNYKQKVNVERRTWDLDVYEQKAKERETTKGVVGGKTNHNKKPKSSSKLKKEAKVGEKRSLDEVINKGEEEDAVQEEFLPAPKGRAGPELSKRAFLKPRQHRVDVIDSKVGTVEMINPEAAATNKAFGDDGASPSDGVVKTGVGWHCKVCDCFLKDSLAYLDHINGKKHQRNLGYTMRVERSTKEQVTSRLAALAEERKKNSTKLLDDTGEEENFYDIVKAKDEEAKRRKEERARKRKERKLQKQKEKMGEFVEEPKKEETGADNVDTKQEEQETEEYDEGGVDPALAAMMGFSGFAAGNKSR